MPIVYNNGNGYAYSGTESAELVLRPAVERPAISDIFGVVEGIKGKQRVFFLNRKDKITKVDPGCGQGAGPLGLTVDNEVWDPEDMKAWVQECWTTYRGTMQEWNLANGNDKSDFSNTKIAQSLEDVIEDAVHADLVRQAWFGDLDLTSGQLAGGSGDLPNYKVYNGIWKRIFTGVSASQIVYVPVDSGNNSLENEESVAILMSMVEKMPDRLAGQDFGSLQLLVSRSIFQNYLRYLVSQKLDASFQMLQSGRTNLQFMGIPLTVINEWGLRINSDFTVSGVPDRPHRAILTMKGNLQLGFDAQPVNAAGENPMETFYDPMSETWNSRLKYAVDTQIASRDLVVAAY